MNAQTAKEILLIYRPGLTTAGDPELLEALALAGKDPELGKWFERHCTAQDSLRQQFKSIEIPEGLREQILSERPSPASQKVRAKAAWAVAAMALALVLVFSLPSFRSQTSTNSVERYRHHMVGMVARAYPQMDIYTNDLGVIRQFLVQNSAPSHFPLSPVLEQTAGTGGKVLTWQKHKVSMVCFRSGLKTSAGPDLFLFVIEGNVFDHKTQNQSPVLQQQGPLLSATWTNGNQTLVLATVGDESFLRKYL